MNEQASTAAAASRFFCATAAAREQQKQAVTESITDDPRYSSISAILAKPKNKKNNEN